MNARVSAPPSGYVKVADAAAELTRRGDAITPSNVSRYLDRNPDISSEKHGRCRFVDLATLILHRSGNIGSHAKQASSLPAEVLPPVTADDTDNTGTGPTISRAIQEANLRLKELQVRDAEREEQLAIGELVPAAEVLSVVTQTAQVLLSEFERAEVSIASRHGRAIATDFRKVRKDAQAKAAERLAQLAQAQLHPKVATDLATTNPFASD